MHCKLENQENVGQVTLRLENKSSHIISNCAIAVTEPSEDAQGVLKVAASTFPKQDIKPYCDATYCIAKIECIKPFSEEICPEIILEYSLVAAGWFSNEHKGDFRVPLNLPVSLKAFVEPMTIDETDFETKWAALEGKGRDAINTLQKKYSADFVEQLHSQVKTPVDTYQLTPFMACVKSLTFYLANSQILPTLRLAPLPTIFSSDSSRLSAFGRLYTGTLHK